MTALVDRYIEVALTGVSSGTRADVEREMRGMIDELVEARVERGERPERATEQVLNELGNPRVLARQYDDGKRYLIGPDQYDTYIDLLRMLLTRVLPLITMIIFVVNLIGSDAPVMSAVGSAVGEALLSTLWIGVMISFWVTVVFAVLERTGNPAISSGSPWSVTDLPEEAPRRQITVADALTGLGFTLVIGTILVVVYRSGMDMYIGDEAVDGTVPFFDPEIPQTMAWLVIGLLVADAALEVVKLSIGFWTRPITVATILLAGVWAVVAMVIIGRWDLVNPGITAVTSDEVADIFLSSWFEMSVLAVALASSA
ncbi:MAG TPA: permease prefix domain 1-containing protein, partial [Thermomicrobiales bacterium]|nr:permease prefix domain 1-containing protein [Thermomicrobiales bacterium]